MEEEAIFIYCLADAVVTACPRSDYPRSLMTHAEIITFVMISALYYRCIAELIQNSNDLSERFLLDFGFLQSTTLSMRQGKILRT